MQQISQLLALAAALSTASAGAIQGFNYGAMTTDDAARMQADFETSFKTAKNLVGTDNAFTSARLYTMIQAYSTSDVIQAIPAAIATNTSLLLGLWCSGTGFANEMTALKAAIQQYGDSGLSDLVIGISVGSEDLYRNSATSMAQGGGIGQDPATLVDYISQVREAIKGTALSGASIGHVDTWDAWTNGTNSAVIEAIDWLGVDEYPYWQLTDGNSVENSAALFNKAYETTVNVANGKEVWVTETGWAVNGKTEGEAVAGTDTSKTYWDSVGCDILFGNVNTWWYTLSETGANPDFGVSESDSNTTPLYDLSCKNVTKATSSSSASSSTATGTSSSGSGSSGSSGSGSAASGTASSGFAIATSGASGNSSSGSNVTVSTASPTAGTSGSTATSSIVPASGAFANTVSLSGLFAAVALVAFAL